MMAVPFMNSSDDPLSAVERQGLPELWAVQQTIPATKQPTLDTNASEKQSVLSPILDRSSRLWEHEKLAPYETAVFFPLETNRTAVAPSHDQSAPDASSFPSLLHSSCHGDDDVAGTVDRPIVVAFPGTMSSRRHSERNRKRRARSAPSQGNACHSRKLSQRFKSIFKKEPVDEDSFEHIDERHWTDE